VAAQEALKRGQVGCGLRSTGNERAIMHVIHYANDTDNMYNVQCTCDAIFLSHLDCLSEEREILINYNGQKTV